MCTSAPPLAWASSQVYYVQRGIAGVVRAALALSYDAAYMPETMRWCAAVCAAFPCPLCARRGSIHTHTRPALMHRSMRVGCMGTRPARAMRWFCAIPHPVDRLGRRGSGVYGVCTNHVYNADTLQMRRLYLFCS